MISVILAALVAGGVAYCPFAVATPVPAAA